MLDIYPYGKTEYIFREDDGLSLDYMENLSCNTKIVVEEKDNEIYVTIGDRIGEYKDKPERRVWKVSLVGTDKPMNIVCLDETAEITA